MDLENTCSACGAKLLWKTKIVSIEHTFDRSAPDVGPRKQFTDPDLENLRQIEHLDIEDAANSRFDLCHGCGRQPSRNAEAWSQIWFATNDADTAAYALAVL